MNFEQLYSYYYTLDLLGGKCFFMSRLNNH